MSRKAADLTGVTLTKSEKLRKTFTKDIPRWFYNSEDGTYLGERKPVQWGKLLLYFLGFYSGLTIFFVINYSVMLASMPLPPDNKYFCSSIDQTNDQLRCHDGPRFKMTPLSRIDDPNADATDVMKMGLIEPTLSVFPANLFIGHSQPISSKTIMDMALQSFISATSDVSANRFYNWEYLKQEARRTRCADLEDPDVLEGVENLQCDPNLINQVFPSVLPVPLAEGEYTNSPLEGNVFHSPAFFDDIPANFYGPPEKISEDNIFHAPLPYLTGANMSYFNEATEQNETTLTNVYLILFRLNKMWNYEPLDQMEQGVRQDRAEIVNDIGTKCYFDNRDRCEIYDSGVNYKGEYVGCDPTAGNVHRNKESGTLSRGGALKIDMLANVMSTQAGFPWQGGMYDLSFGAALVTWDLAKETGTTRKKKSESIRVRCEWGVETNNGKRADGTTVPYTRHVKNRFKDKQGYEPTSEGLRFNKNTGFGAADFDIYQFD